MKRKSLFAALALCLLLSAAGCNTAAPAETPSPSPTPAQNETAEPAETPKSHYPVDIITYNYAGEEVATTYEKAPERVLAVYQGSIETLIVLGLEDSVFASYGLDNEVKDEWKDAFSRMNYDESVFAPDRETVMTMQPDLILSWGSLFGEKTLGDVDYWHANGTNTYINSNTRAGGARILENEFTDILNIGKIFDVEDRAEAFLNQMRADIETTRAAVAAEPTVPTVAILGFYTDGIRNFGLELAGDIAGSLGVEVMQSAERYIGKEDLVAANPDVIFVEYMPRPDGGGDAVRDEQLAKLLDDPALASLSAVQNGKVYAIMLGDIYAPAVRTGDGIRTIAEGLFPGIFG
ncbi:MAG: ABC transporter substrate-binding protein [Oscillospiraceae bacterium]|jgi:iron complex transport system substrate-binding protein|nr:ABC transporter substrate-binding protein [Oscillospiraceae bacterium]